ncbi:MAG: 16S rRNA (guanine(966)-N(2))-methyltransferase RsmD [Eubacteriales bacterium]|nr:16S rRNA (guanine(966)-N(2))-methyltransferase RsmD [Eubacteriales bacterium]MDD4513054.1 16S rRNA (guanine(966)-N(2))-methyltransferase RsmD [Eubacteriales bacterium]
MRIIAGDMRGRVFLAPKTDKTRPTLDQVRESLFNILRERIDEETTVLDLFAGSGALAFEALSRGAGFAVLCDSGREAVKTLRQNIASLRLEDKTELYAIPYEAALQRMTKRFSLVFLDPPYELCDYEKMLSLLRETGRLEEGALIAVERSVRHPLVLPCGFELLDERKYRDTVISFVTPCKTTDEKE